MTVNRWYLQAASIISLILFTAGCTTQRSQIEIGLLETTSPVGTTEDINGTVNDYYQEEGLYRKALLGNDIKAQKAALSMMKMDRDEVVYYYIFIIDNFYAKAGRELIGKTDWAKTGSDIVQLGLTSAATLVGGAETKSILAAIATGVNGSQLSIAKNILNNSAIELIYARMKALVDAQATLIQGKLSKSAVDYSLRAAAIDLAEMYNCGSFSNALQTMRNEASKPQATNSTNAKVETQTSDTTVPATKTTTTTTVPK
jgi:hypothetical protein